MMTNTITPEAMAKELCDKHGYNRAYRGVSSMLHQSMMSKPREDFWIAVLEALKSYDA